MVTYRYSFTRDDDTEVEIEYRLDPYDPGVLSGPAEHCYPPEGGGLAYWKIAGSYDGAVLTGAEIDRMETEITNLPHDHYDHGPDYDYLRDQRMDDRLTGGSDQ